MTYCAPDDPSWVLHAKTLEIDPARGEGQAWGAKLRVSGVPVFYLPWVQFPVDSRRKTGLLFPDIGSDSRGGVDITQPIYFNLAPNYDALYRPDTFRNEDLHRGQADGWRSLPLEFVAPGSATTSVIRMNPDVDANRWLFNTQHNGQFGSAWRTKIAYTQLTPVCA